MQTILSLQAVSVIVMKICMSSYILNNINIQLKLIATRSVILEAFFF